LRAASDPLISVDLIGAQQLRLSVDEADQGKRQ